MIEYARKSLKHSIQQNPRVDFLWTESTVKTRCFFTLLKKKKMNEEAGSFGVCFPSLTVCFAYLLALQFFFSCQFWILYFECLYKMVIFEALTQSPFLPLAVGKIPGYEIENCQFSSRFSFLSYLQINACIFCIFSIDQIWYASKKWLKRNDFAQFLSVFKEVVFP